jgi:hypothetical protein
MSNPYTFSKEQITEQINDIGGETAPTRAKFDEEAEIPLGTVTRYFDNWTAALAAAGYETNPTSYTKADLIEQVQAMAAETGSPPSSPTFSDADHTASLSAVYRRFDSWEDFLIAADLDPSEMQSAGYTAADLVAAIKQVGEELGRSPTSEEFQQHPETPTFHLIYRHFDTWGEAVEAAGFEPNNHVREYSREELLAIVEAFAKETPPDNITDQNFDAKENTPSISTIRRRFGSLKAAIEAAETEKTTL